MRFSIVSGPRQRSDLGETAYQAQRNFVEDAILADRLGFDGSFFGEHHFCFASGNSSPLTMLAEVAARTKNIRVGTSVICAPFHNPLRLAEDIASVDMISNGRFDLGIGVGSQWEEFQTFGIDPKERFGRTWEVIDIIERCLSSPVDEVFDWKGKYFDFPGIRWIMQPVQKRVPIFWGGFGPQGVTRAAERGYNLIAPDVTGTYQRIMAERGRDPKQALIGFTTSISIGDTYRDAMEKVVEAATWVSNQYAIRPDLDGNFPPKDAIYTPDDIYAAAKSGATPFAPPRPGEKPAPFILPVAGTVSDLRDHFLKVVRGERGLITNLCISVREPGVATEDAHSTLNLFAREIMPALKEEAVNQGI